MSHHHTHGNGHSHSLGPLSNQALNSNDVHQIGRRRFLADLGRGSFAIAILGLAACTSDSNAAPASTTSTPTTSPATGDGLRWAQVKYSSVSAYVLVRGSSAAVVDTGNGGSDEIGSTLATLGLTFDNVEHVILTHSHPDHIGGLSDLLAVSPTAMLYAGEADLAAIRSPNPLAAVGDGDSVFGLDVYNTPGHTPGSISIIDTEIGLLVAGDALNGNAEGSEISGANPSFSNDMAAAALSVKKLAGLTVETALFGHGNPVASGAGPLLTSLADSL